MYLNAKALTIAGSDSSGGAGIQADLKTFTVHKVFGMSVITAVTVQNTCGVYAVQDIAPDIVAGQIDAVFNDIRPDAVKIGMVSSAEIISVIAEKLKEHKAERIVLDTVMVSTSGHRLLREDAQSMLIEKLLPLADIITPNTFEAQCLSGISIENKEDMLAAAQKIAKNFNGYILVKGGHLASCADDLLYKGGETVWYEAERIDNPNTHGTGCTLSSAIAANLAMGQSMDSAVKNAKEFVAQAIRSKVQFGKGRGPIDHCCRM